MRSPFDPMAGPSTFKRIHVIRGFGVPDEVDLNFLGEPREACEPQEITCGQMAVPSDVTLRAYNETVRPGESVEVGDVYTTEVFLVRAEHRPVIDPMCEAEGEQGERNIPGDPGAAITYMEMVIVAGSGR